jgi:hypothetical protein
MRGCSLALSCALLHRKSGLYWPRPAMGGGGGEQEHNAYVERPVWWLGR